MAVRTRTEYCGLDANISARRRYPASRLGSHVTGIQVQRNKAIVGQNAFAHEAGIHQDGMLKERSTYEIMNPEDIGLPKTQLVLGKHSGRHALRQRLRELGFHLSEDQMQRVFETGAPAAAAETQRIARDGRSIPVLRSSWPVFDASRRVVGLLDLLVDITGLKQLDEESRALAQVRERELISMDLHDGPIQSL